MSTPEFVLELRKKIGHDLLWLNGVTGCVLNEHGQLLLGRRSDTGEWAMVYGINEPGEQPADTVVREIKEETGIDAIVTDLVAVTSSNKVLTYANGDNTMYMDHSFLCALKPGGNAEPFVGDEESLSVGWFDLDDLPTPWRPARASGWSCSILTSRTKTRRRPRPVPVRWAAVLADIKLAPLTRELQCYAITPLGLGARGGGRGVAAVRAGRARAGRPAASWCTGSPGAA